MRNPPKEPVITLTVLQKVVLYSLIFVILLLGGTIIRLNSRITDLEEQRDIYKARAENWSQRAIEDEEKLDQLQNDTLDVQTMAAMVTDGIVVSQMKFIDISVKETPEPTIVPTPAPTTTPTATPEPTAAPAEEPIDISEENGIDSNWTYAGEFMCTAYCCEKYKHICGEGKGITASGAPVTAGTTVAADTKRFKYGTVLYIEGVGYRTVQDKGSAIKGNKLDVAVDTHANALKWSGYGKHRVWVVSTPD